MMSNLVSKIKQKMIDFDFLTDTDDNEFGPMPMTKDEFIQKTKAMLSAIMDRYTMCWSNRFEEDDESEENSCPRCGGFTQIEQGGYIVDCYSCKGTGLSNERVFDKDGFVEFMEHTVMFGTEPFLELMECEILPEHP